jgi:hypothetical protein
MAAPDAMSTYVAARSQILKKNDPNYKKEFLKMKHLALTPLANGKN